MMTMLREQPPSQDSPLMLLDQFECVHFPFYSFFVTLIDEHSGYSTVSLMRRKLQATDALRETSLDIENLFKSCTSILIVLNGKHVKWLRSDGGGEYVCKNLREWLRSCGVVHELTVGRKAA